MWVFVLVLLVFGSPLFDGGWRGARGFKRRVEGNIGVLGGNLGFRVVCFLRRLYRGRIIRRSIHMQFFWSSGVWLWRCQCCFGSNWSFSMNCVLTC